MNSIKFLEPTEFSFNKMDEVSAKRALALLATAVSFQDRESEVWIDTHLGQFGCSINGLLNEVLCDPVLTRTPQGQGLHHAYRLYNNPEDDDGVQFVPVQNGGKGGKTPGNRLTYTALDPQDLIDNHVALYGGGEYYDSLANSDEVAVDTATTPNQKALFADVQSDEDEAPADVDHTDDVTVGNATSSNRKVSFADYQFSDEEADAEDSFSVYDSEPEDHTSDFSDADKSDGDEYIEMASSRIEDLSFDKQLALTIEASLKDRGGSPAKYNGEASGTNGRPITPPPSVEKSPGGKSVLSSAHSLGGKHYFGGKSLPASSSAAATTSSGEKSAPPSRSPSPPRSLKRGRSSSFSDSSSEDDNKPSSSRPAKRVKKSAATPSSSRSTARKTPKSSGSKPRKPPARKAASGCSAPRRSTWSNDETKILLKVLQERRAVEARTPGLPILYDTPLWNHVSEALAGVHNIHRAPGGCKAHWSRNCRMATGFDERSELKRSKEMATSIQSSKKGKKDKKGKGKMPATKEDDEEAEDDADDDE